ncbi:MAG: hypothetical protein ABWZ82_05295 [Candidatus Limnocylindrales bacterium]
MSAQDASVTLRLAVSDAADRPSAPIVMTFIDEVARRSGGSVTLEPIWEAGGEDFEQGVARMVVDGDADLGVAAGRAWDSVGITSFEALQAPFLIDNDALARAVATSPVADAMLAGMAGSGVAGLALWPEDLRHPVALEPCSDPIVEPAQLAGRTVRAIGSSVTEDLLDTLGANHILGFDRSDVDACRVHAVESGLRQGQSLANLASRPTFTGDVVFFPKFQVLAANGVAFEHLSASQRQAITEAALAARDQAIADHPSEVEAAAEWCAAGGRVVLAGPAGIAAFEQAAQPVFERIAADPVGAAAIESIRALRETVEPAPGAQACEPQVRPSFAIPDTFALPDTTGYSGELPPDGTYRTGATADELIAAGADPDYAYRNDGIATVTYENGQVTFVADDPNGTQRPCTADMTSQDGTFVRMVSTSPSVCGLTFDFVWRVDGDDLFTIVVGSSETGWSEQDFRNEWAWKDIPLTRIE